MTNNHYNITVLEDDRHSKSQVNIRDVSDVSDEDIFFAKERYKLHQSTPGEGVDINILKKYFFKNYGF